jgi:hypothetical protein
VAAPALGLPEAQPVWTGSSFRFPRGAWRVKSKKAVFALKNGGGGRRNMRNLLVAKTIDKTLEHTELKQYRNLAVAKKT